jgi:hypothetical protein
LANLSTGAASNSSKLPIVEGKTTNLAQGVAGIASGFKTTGNTYNYNTPATPVKSGAGGGFGPNYNTPYVP